LRCFFSDQEEAGILTDQDSDGRIPLLRALLLRYSKVVEYLIQKMEQADKKAFDESRKICYLREDSIGDLTAAALEEVDGEDKLDEEIAHRVVAWEIAHIAPGKGLLWHHLARKGYVTAFKKAHAWFRSKYGLESYRIQIQEKDGILKTPLE